MTGQNLYPIGTRVISTRWEKPELCAYMGCLYGVHHVQPVDPEGRAIWSVGGPFGWPDGTYTINAAQIKEIAG